LCGHSTLDLHRAANGIALARKLYKEAVTSGFDDPATMGSYGGINNGLSDRLEPSKGTFVVGTHEAPITSNVRRQHRRQTLVVLYSKAPLTWDSAESIKACQTGFGLGPSPESSNLTDPELPAQAECRQTFFKV
jgi:hypothetical protein